MVSSESLLAEKCTAKTIFANRKFFTPDFQPMINTMFWSAMGFYYLQFIIPQFAELLNIEGLQMGFIFSSITLGNILSAPLVGAITDKMNKKKIAAMGIFGRGTAYLIMYFAILLKSYVLFLISTVFLGFMVSFFWIPFNHMIAAKSHPDHRSFAYSQRDSAVGKGGLLGGIAGFLVFFLGDNLIHSLAITYISLIAFMVANFYAGIQFLRNIDENQALSEEFSGDDPDLATQIDDENPCKLNKTNNKKSQSFSSKYFVFGILVMLLGYFLTSTNNNLAMPFMQTFILRKITPDAALMILIYIPSGIVPMILAPKIGRTVEKVNIFSGLALATLLGGFMTFLLIVIKNMVIFSIILVVDTAIALSESLILDKFISRISKSHRGKMFGSREVFVNLGGVTGPIIGGLLWRQWYIEMPFIASIMVEILIIPVMFLGIWLIKPHLTE